MLRPQRSGFSGLPRAVGFAIFGVAIAVGMAGCIDAPPDRDPQEEAARAQVNKWADRLDAQTDEFGSYISHPQPDLDETDPWGNPLKVAYSRDGASENLVIRSAGQDRTFHTSDDLTATRIAVDFKGVGRGVRENAQATAQNAARGAVKGTVEGIKDELKGVFRRKRDRE